MQRSLGGGVVLCIHGLNEPCNASGKAVIITIAHGRACLDAPLSLSNVVKLQSLLNLRFDKDEIVNDRRFYLRRQGPWRGQDLACWRRRG